MKMPKEIGIDIAWGFGLWLLGFALGLLFFPFIPFKYIGLVITPFELAAACKIITPTMVLFYYLSTFLLPLIVGRWRS